MQELHDEVVRKAGVRLLIKRDDLIHPVVSGNKWRKLKYNLVRARELGYNTLVTFGGAYSNHLFALAAAGSVADFSTIGIVRGDELTPQSSPTLQYCQEQGMQLHFVSREEYRHKDEGALVASLLGQHRNIFVVPEGGSNELALPGVREMVQEVEAQLIGQPDYFAVAAGTGGTTAGILSALAPVLAFSALKGGGFLREEINTLVGKEALTAHLQLITNYHFGGYARYTSELLDFIRGFEQQHQIPLEQVYTGKMLFGLYDLMRKGYFTPGSTLVAVHTGGLQGRLASLNQVD
ncbi:1-aminocyclopropane-1-carboxylate deaminase/D-cysteine desulfhydrase [Telluribacter sp. SYSU D00476]|uniref:1-aminocyclopropane-1-carboxylate deaminase/D-cysteine desulfhydrase n=1 Tax=Telluribacter sp. SYSU D00476 TaxID=2811430 RepID=UPI001FF6F1F2|nr:pyridoxal-phosphate dependent enzyme [Telluribacter sp. SYSU D00476]